MAFNFFGTFTTGQFECLRAFTQIQRRDLYLRKRWLESELRRVGKFSTKYDGYTPDSFSAFPANSYAAKLLKAYKILGGSPEKDMLLRTRDMPVFLTTGREFENNPNEVGVSGASAIYSNGRRDRGTQRFDRDLGLRVMTLKNWQLGAIKFKRERLEYKIKKALDHSDQISQEIESIKILLGSSDDSVDGQIQEIEIQANTPGTANIVQNRSDCYGLKIGTIADRSFPDVIREGEQTDQRGLV